MNLIETFRAKLFSSFEENKNSIYLGEDVRNAHRGIAIGLHEKFGDYKVIDMPISESGFTGLGLGLAISGKNVFVEFNFAGLILLGLDQIFNQAHKYNEMMNSNINLNITYILPTGTRGGLAGHHSDNPYPILSHLGIRSYVLSTPFDCEKIFEKLHNSPKPTALFLPVAAFNNEEIPRNEYDNFGFYKAIDGVELNIICTGTTYKYIEESIQEINKKSPNVYILTDILFQKDTIKSIQNIEKLPVLFIDDTFETCGLSSELQKYIDKDFWLGSLNRYSKNVPFSKTLEDKVIVGKDRIINCLKEVIK